MKAVICTSYSPPEVLHVKDVEEPVPAANEVLEKWMRLRLHAVILRYPFGARVTGVYSIKHLDTIKSIDADSVIDYTKDIATNQDRFDLIFEAVAKSVKRKIKQLLNPGGKFITVHDSYGSILITNKELQFIADGLKQGT